MDGGKTVFSWTKWNNTSVTAYEKTNSAESTSHCIRFLGENSKFVDWNKSLEAIFISKFKYEFSWPSYSMKYFFEMRHPLIAGFISRVGFTGLYTGTKFY